MAWVFLGALLLVGAGGADSGGRTVEEISWKTLDQTRQLLGGEIVEAEAGVAREILKVDNPKGKPSWITVFKIEKPQVGPPAFGIEGDVRYEGVEGVGLLEMWGHFGVGEESFSLPGRTSGGGLTAPLRDKSPWRPFRAALALGNLKAAPGSLEFKVVLPGRGAVFLRDVRLVQYTENAAWLADEGIDWSKFTGVLIVVGATLGILVCQIVATALLTRTLAATRIALRLTLIGQALGAGALVAGIYFASHPPTSMVGLALVCAAAVDIGAVWAMVPWIHRRQGELDTQRVPMIASNFGD